MSCLTVPLAPVPGTALWSKAGGWVSGREGGGSRGARAGPGLLGPSCFRIPVLLGGLSPGPPARSLETQA